MGFPQVGRKLVKGKWLGAGGAVEKLWKSCGKLVELGFGVLLVVTGKGRPLPAGRTATGEGDNGEEVVGGEEVFEVFAGVEADAEGFGPTTGAADVEVGFHFWPSFSRRRLM